MKDRIKVNATVIGTLHKYAHSSNILKRKKCKKKKQKNQTDNAGLGPAECVLNLNRFFSVLEIQLS